jgi:hypothetical protein
MGYLHISKELSSLAILAALFLRNVSPWILLLDLRKFVEDVALVELFSVVRTVPFNFLLAFMI